jgi:O-antigen/teichoic acid export membrane protein
VLRNIGSSWVMTLVTIAATYVLTPFVLRTVGHEAYGTWALISSFTGYISLLALGVPMACVRYLAEHVAQGDSRRINQTVGSCAGLYLAIGGVAVVIGIVLMIVFALYEVPSSLETEALAAFGMMVLQVSAGFIGFLPEGILFAHHAFVLRNLIRIAGVLLRLTLIIGLLQLRPSLVVLAGVQIVSLVFDFSVSWLVIRRRYPAIRISLADFESAMVRRIFSFSLYVLLLNAGARLSFETDALVIGAFLGVSMIPFYTVANSFIIYLMDFIVGIAAVVSPMATKLKTEGDVDRLKEIFLTWSKVALSLTLGAGLFLIVLGPRFMGWWIDPSFEHPAGEVLQILMISSLVFLPVRGVALPILMGLGKPKAPTLTFAAAGLLNLGLSILLVGPLGLVGVALGTAIPNVLFAIIVLALACRELQIGVRSYLAYVVPRAALGALPILALLLWFRIGLQVQTIHGLVAAGSAMVLLFGITWMLFVYRNDPYMNLRPYLIRIRSWNRA